LRAEVDRLTAELAKHIKPQAAPEVAPWDLRPGQPGFRMPTRQEVQEERTRERLETNGRAQV